MAKKDDGICPDLDQMLSREDEFKLAVKLGGFLSQDHVGQDELWDEVQPMIFELIESMAGGHQKRLRYMVKELPHVFKIVDSNH